MERYNSDFSQILPKFTELRCEDAHAICELAMYNYIEVTLLLKFRFPQFKLTFRAAKSKALELVVFSFLDRLKRILNNITIIFEISPIEKMRSLGLS